MTGDVDVTLIRGTVVVQDGELQVEPGFGQFVEAREVRRAARLTEPKRARTLCQIVTRSWLADDPSTTPPAGRASLSAGVERVHQWVHAGEHAAGFGYQAHT